MFLFELLICDDFDYCADYFGSCVCFDLDWLVCCFTCFLVLWVLLCYGVLVGGIRCILLGSFVKGLLLTVGVLLCLLVNCLCLNTYGGLAVLVLFDFLLVIVFAYCDSTCC